MNLDRLYAILRPLAYLEAVRHQLFKKKQKKHTFCKKKKSGLVNISNDSQSGKAEKVWSSNADHPLLSGNF